MTEKENRLHCCCFTGHRPEKLTVSEAEARRLLEKAVDRAIADGYDTFITGCARGIDIWAGQTVLQKKTDHPSIRLIAASPWPDFSSGWSEDWKRQYADLLSRADQVVHVSETYHPGVFRKRNQYMVDRSARVIAFYNGSLGGTRNTIEYAEKQGVEVIYL